MDVHAPHLQKAGQQNNCVCTLPQTRPCTLADGAGEGDCGVPVAGVVS